MAAALSLDLLPENPSQRMHPFELSLSTMNLMTSQDNNASHGAPILPYI
jgi:hypothetical protein